MIPLLGDILNWLAAGLLFPLMLLPLAGLVRGRLPSALVFAALLAGVAGASVLFAHLAVDLAPPRVSAGFLLTAGMGASALFLASLSAGARMVVSGLAPQVETLVRGAGRISQIIVLAMAAIQFAAVILRYVFGLNFIAMQESVTYLHGAVFLLAGGYALLTDDHVRVDIFYREASPRRKALIDLAGTYLLLLPFCLVALWAAAPYVANSWAVREGSVEQSGIRGVYLLKTLIPLYLTLLLLAGFSAAARAAETLRPSKG